LSGGLVNPIVAIGQMSYLIFMKRLEDGDNRGQQEAEFLGKTYKPIFEGHEDCKWSYWKNLPAEEILEHVRDRVFPFMRNLGDGDSL